jgi:hypothetical protein
MDKKCIWQRGAFSVNISSPLMIFSSLDAMKLVQEIRLCQMTNEYIIEHKIIKKSLSCVAYHGIEEFTQMSHSSHTDRPATK